MNIESTVRTALVKGVSWENAPIVTDEHGVVIKVTVDESETHFAGIVLHGAGMHTPLSRATGRLKARYELFEGEITLKITQ